MARITQRDIARAAQVDQSTVSLALRGSREIPEKTRDRIFHLAEKMGYRPDPAMSRLAMNRFRERSDAPSAAMAFVSESRPEDRTGSYRDRNEQAGARRQAERLGYQVEVFYLSDYKDPARLFQVLANRGISGILLGRLFHENGMDFRMLDSFAVLACGYGAVVPPCNLIVTDCAEAVRISLREVLARGYKRPGLLLLDQGWVPDDWQRYGAFVFEQRHFPKGVEQIPVCFSDFDPEDKRMTRWLQEWQPDVILGFNPAFYYTVTSLGFKIPEDIGFVSLSILRGEEQLAGVLIDQEHIGQQAASNLDMMLRHNHIGLPIHSTITWVQPGWQEGRTLRKPEAIGH